MRKYRVMVLVLKSIASDSGTVQRHCLHCGTIAFLVVVTEIIKYCFCFGVSRSIHGTLQKVDGRDACIQQGEQRSYTMKRRTTLATISIPLLLSNFNCTYDGANEGQ